MTPKIRNSSKENTSFISNGKLNTSILPNKVFQPRESLLTDIFKEKDVNILHNVWTTMFLYTMIYSAFKDYQNNEWPSFGTKLLRNNFLQFNVAFLIWTSVFTTSLLVYYVFLFWGQVRRFVPHKFTVYWDKVFVLVCIIYAIGLVYFTSRAVVTNEIGMGFSLAIAAEMTRALMKFYAFVRSNCTKYLNYKEKEVASVSHYLYFLFAPTLVYMDTYPRSQGNIRWRFALHYFIRFIQIILVGSITYEHGNLYKLKEYGIKVFTFTDVLGVIVQNSTLGLYGFILLQLGIHYYMNTAAELMKFSDRQFYKDWWTATNPGQFLRKWNTFVYDWLFVYVYKDFYENLLPGRKMCAKLAVLVISAIFHDLIICVACRFYLPLMSVTFGCVIIFHPFLNSNCLCLPLVGIYVSQLFTLYTIEYYARLHCPLENVTVLENLKPRFLDCKGNFN